MGNREIVDGITECGLCVDDNTQENTIGQIPHVARLIIQVEIMERENTGMLKPIPVATETLQINVNGKSFGDCQNKKNILVDYIRNMANMINGQKKNGI